MEPRIYDFDDYKLAIKAFISQPKAGRGYHSRMAEAAGCQSSFLSQVLGSHIHLTADHIAGISDFLGLNEAEHEYFQALLTLVRSTSPRLLRETRRKIQKLKSEHENIATRVRVNQIGYGPDEVTYYSAWYWTAIHVLASIENFRRPNQIAAKLSLPKELVEVCLARLSEMNLLEKKGNEWHVTKHHIHLPKNSVLISTHHANWRLQAANKAAINDSDSLQYSVVTAVSNKDVQRIKNMLFEFIEKSREVIGPSKEEELIYVGLDCFRI